MSLFGPQNAYYQRLRQIAPGVFVAIMALAVFLSLHGEFVHSELLKFGERTWEGYTELRHADSIAAPDCEREMDIDAALRQVIQEKEAEMADDPLAELFWNGVNEQAERRSLEARLALCRERWASYERVMARLTPGVKAFRALEKGVATLVSALGNLKRFLPHLLIILCATVATLKRFSVSLRPLATIKDHHVSTMVQLLANLGLLAAFLYHWHLQLHLSYGQQGLQWYIDRIGIFSFATLSLISSYQLRRPPVGLQQEGAWAPAFIAIPFATLVCLVACVMLWLRWYHTPWGIYIVTVLELWYRLLIALLLP